MRNRKHRRRTGERFLGMLLFLSGSLLLVQLGRSRLQPLVRDLAVTAAKNAATHAIHSVVAEKMAAGELDYGQLVRLEKDESGMITAVAADMQRVNVLQASLADGVLKRMTEPSAADLSVPIGNLLGMPLLSGHGPEIPIRILSVAELEARLCSGLEHSGINQTLHRIRLEVCGTVYVLIPGGTITAEVSDQVTVAETVIVGRVPDSYMYFESDDNWDEALEQYDILS